MEYNEISINLCQNVNFINKNRIDNYYYQLFQDTEFHRIYVGSEICSRFLKYFIINIGSVQESLNKLNKRVSMVLPDFKEENWSILDKLIKFSLENDCIDEVIVNDIGTLSYCASQILGIKKIVLGRLFNKAPREARVDMWDFSGITDRFVLSELIYDTEYYKGLMEDYKIERVELDYIDDRFIENLKTNLNLNVHIPYTYISSGAVCAIGSILKEDKDKFSLSGNCTFECQKYHIKIDNKQINNEIISEGNAFFYKNNIKDSLIFKKDINNRIVYKPILE